MEAKLGRTINLKLNAGKLNSLQVSTLREYSILNQLDYFYIT